MRIRLTDLREDAGLSKAALSRLSETSLSDISGLENGRLRPRRGSTTLAKLATALHWTGDPHELLDEAMREHRYDPGRGHVMTCAGEGCRLGRASAEEDEP